MPSTTQDLERKIAWRSDFYDIWRTRGHTIVVAASNSLDPTLADPAYRCDGTADQAEINAAITALGATGGAVILLDGTFEITGQINMTSNVALVGQGAGTVLRIPNGHDANLNVIYGNGIDHVMVANLKIDGNRANQAAGIMNGIYFDTVTYSMVKGCWIENIYDREGINLSDSSNHNTVTGNTCQGNEDSGIYLEGSNHNTIAGNTCQGNDYGIYVDSSNHNTVTGNTSQGNGIDNIDIYNASSYNTIAGNTCQGSSWGIMIALNSRYNTVTGNTFQGNDYDGIYLGTTNHNTIAGNTVEGNSQDTHNTNDGIFVDANSDYNNIQGNTVRQGVGANKQRYGINIAAATCDGNLVICNDLYSAGATANFSDAGTGTVVRDNRGWVTENNVLSPAFAIDAVAVVTVTIPHGLDVTPAAEDCQLTVVEDTDVDDWEEGYVKVESVGAANVVAKVNVTTASATGGATAKLALHVDLAGG